VARNDDDLAAILYTSGTTGRSKGAMLTQANLLSNARTLVRAWAFTADDVLLHALPIFHTHGLFVACHTCLLSGARMLFHPGFDPDRVIPSLTDTTVLMGVPTFYTRLLADERFTHAAAQPLRLFVSGSAPLLAVTPSPNRVRSEPSMYAIPTCSRATGGCPTGPPGSCSRTASSSPVTWRRSMRTATSRSWAGTRTW